jgi:hypothetical protein
MALPCSLFMSANTGIYQALIVALLIDWLFSGKQLVQNSIRIRT